MLVVLTRPTQRAMALTGKLRKAGHAVRCVPLTGIVDLEPFPDPKGYEGVLFTSVSAVERAPFDAPWPRVGAVGPVTLAALDMRGIQVDVLGTGGGAELAEAWGDCVGQRLLLPQAEGAHPSLADGLLAKGANLTCARVYRSTPLDDVDRAVFLDADVICLFAPSQVEAFRELGVTTSASFCAYGPTTLAAMTGLGPVIGTDELFTD